MVTHDAQQKKSAELQVKVSKLQQVSAFVLRRARGRPAGPASNFARPLAPPAPPIRAQIAGEQAAEVGKLGAILKSIKRANTGEARARGERRGTSLRRARETRRARRHTSPPCVS